MQGCIQGGVGTGAHETDTQGSNLTERELAMPPGGQRTVCGSLPSLPGTPTLPLFLHRSSLAPWDLPHNPSHFKLSFQFTALFQSAASQTPREQGAGQRMLTGAPPGPPISTPPNKCHMRPAGPTQPRQGSQSEWPFRQMSQAKEE